MSRDSAEVATLLRAIEPLVAEYERIRDPGTADLYDDQPISLRTNLGVLRRLALYYTVLARAYLK